MRIESTEFTAGDLDGFVDELEERERIALGGRLAAASTRLESLGARVAGTGAAGGPSWSARETLAHIAVLSKFYGVLTYQIGTGKLEDLDLLGMVHLRDVQGAELARHDPAEVLAQALADQRRTVDFLRGARAADLRRSCRMGNGRSMTAADVARLPLCAHLELHLDQLEAALAG